MIVVTIVLPVVIVGVIVAASWMGIDTGKLRKSDAASQYQGIQPLETREAP